LAQRPGGWKAQETLCGGVQVKQIPMPIDEYQHIWTAFQDSPEPFAFG